MRTRFPSLIIVDVDGVDVVDVVPINELLEDEAARAACRFAFRVEVVNIVDRSTLAALGAC